MMDGGRKEGVMQAVEGSRSKDGGRKKGEKWKVGGGGGKVKPYM
jgi:hypothetical protein